MKLFSLLPGILFALIFCVPVSAQVELGRTVNVGLLNGKAVSLPKPGYPESLKGTGIEGAVAVNVLIDQNGAVVRAEADLNDARIKWNADGTEAQPVVVDPLLRDAAENAARDARFSPTLLSGQPVMVKGKIMYNFVSGYAVATTDSRPSTSTGGVLNGKATSLPAPRYPAAAKAVRAEGAVSVQVLIDEEGNVASASAVSGHPLLRAAATAAASEAKFLPTHLSGHPIKVSGVLTYNFVLPKKEDQ